MVLLGYDRWEKFGGKSTQDMKKKLERRVKLQEKKLVQESRELPQTSELHDV